MKNLLFFLAFITSLKVNAQLGNSYTTVLNEIKSKEYEIKKEAKYYYIVAFEDEESQSHLIGVAYFFNYSDNICYCVSFMYPLSSINHLVELMNGKYVKEADMLWKDYENEIYYEIRKGEDKVFLRKYLI